MRNSAWLKTDCRALASLGE